jgi:hypothetical protein
MSRRASSHISFPAKGGREVQADLEVGRWQGEPEIDVGEQKPTIGICREGTGIDHPGRGALRIEMAYLNQLPLDSPELTKSLLAHAEHTQMNDLSEKRLIPLGLSSTGRPNRFCTPATHTTGLPSPSAINFMCFMVNYSPAVAFANSLQY